MAAGNSPAIFGFDPRSVPSMCIWLDGLDPLANGTVLANGTTVPIWYNKSPGGVNFTTYSGKSPPVISNSSFNGYPSVYFNGTTQALYNTSNVQTTQNATFVMVTRSINPNNGYPTQVDQRKDTGGTALRTFYANQFQVRDSAGNIQTSPGYTIPTTQIQVWRDKLNYGEWYVNGTLQYTASGTYNQTATDACFIGIGSHYSGNFSETFYMAEFLVYNEYLTDSQCRQLEGYLAHKWGLNTALVGGLAKPTQIPGCALWLDGADSTSMTFSSGSNVSVWSDKSGKGWNATQPSTGQQPTYVSNVIQTRSSGSQYMSINQALGNALVGTTWDVFVVGQRISTGYNNFISGTEATPNQNLMLGFDTGGTSLTINLYATGVGGTVSNWTSGEPYSVFGFEYNGTTQSVFKTGSLLGSSNVTLSLTAFTGPQIGRRYGGNSGAVYQDFNYSEIVIFTPSITTSQRQGVEGYLATKWGLRASLPAAHPSYTGIAAQPFALVRPFARAFQPIDIPGLALWLDGADQSTITFGSGLNVSQWKDKSGNGSHATSVSTGPTYSQPGVVFNGSPMRSSKTVTNNASFSIFSVVNASSPAPTTNYAVCGAWKNLYGSYGFFFTGSPSIRGNVSTGTGYAQGIATTTGLPASSGTILGLVIDGDTTSSSGTTSLNGTTIVTNVTGPNYAGQDEFFGIGCVFEGGSPQYVLSSTTISEIIAFKVALTTSQRQQIEGYLAWKWGLNSVLPSGHSFYRLPASSSLPFAPPMISGCALWLDGADPSSMTFSSGSNITTLTDKSGLGHAFTATGTPVLQANSLNGLSSLSFNGSSYLYNTTSQLSVLNHTIFCVAAASNVTNTTANSFISFSSGTINGEGASNAFIYRFYTNVAGNANAFDLIGSGYRLYTNAANTSPIVYTETISAGTGGLYLNGVVPSYQYSTFTTSGSGTTQGCVLGCRWQGATGATNFYIGNIYEIIAYNTTLTTSQRQTIEGYLAQKWGLNGSLPSTHPYTKFGPSTP